MNTSCTGQDWSPVASASANSQLAGLLAGFVFAGIVMILSTRRSGQMRFQTLRLFCASFIVLGLASYLFGLVTGDNTMKACKRAWTEAMVASGLLGVGAVAIISGIAWLLAAYLIRGQRRRKSMTQQAADSNLVRLERLSHWMVYSVVAVVTLLLAVTTNGYVNSFYDTDATKWLQWVAILYPIPVLGIVGLLKLVRPSAAAALTVGVVSTMVYSVFGALMDGIITDTTVAFWNPPPQAIGITISIVALVMPAPTLIALAYAVPPLSPSPEHSDRSWARRTALRLAKAVVRSIESDGVPLE